MVACFVEATTWLHVSSRPQRGCMFRRGHNVVACFVEGTTWLHVSSRPQNTYSQQFNSHNRGLNSHIVFYEMPTLAHPAKGNSYIY